MRTLLITVHFQAQNFDLKVPAELPIGELLPTLLKTCSEPLAMNPGAPSAWGLGRLGSEAPLPSKQTLIEAGIFNGAKLMLGELIDWPSPLEEDTSTRLLTPGRDRETGGASTVYHIPVRDYPTRLPEEEIVISAPPTLPTNQGGVAGWVQLLLPVLGALGGSMFMVIFLINGGFGGKGGNNTLIFILAIALPVLMIGTSIGTNLVQRWITKRQRKIARKAYMEYLNAWRTRLNAIADMQRKESSRLYPRSKVLASLVMQRNYLWERRAEDYDFLHIAIGRGPAPLCSKLRLELSSDPIVKYETDLRSRAESLVAEYHHLDDEPAVISLRGIGTMAISGGYTATRALVRALLCQIVTFHSPKDVRCVAFFPPNVAQEWTWLRWLPHFQRLRYIKSGKQQSAEALCLLASYPNDCADLLVNQIKPELELRRKLSEDKSSNEIRPMLPHLIFIIDGYSLGGPLAQIPELDELFREASRLGVTIICLVGEQNQEPSGTQARITIIGGEWLNFEIATYGGRRIKGIAPNSADAATCEQIARSLAPLTLAGEGGDEDLSQDVRLLDLLDIPSADIIHPEVTWRPRERALALRAPIGKREKGKALLLDLKEAAEKGDGPHGLVIGATGSGKSELLRTLVISQAIAHDPYTVNFVFVDFKGGASFADLANLPHVAGMITNLENEPSLVDRMHASLLGELKRRQYMLREAGNLDNVQQYRVKWQANLDMAPMPHLLVIVDEFAELLTNRPEFLDLFITIGRLGRSLGIHLLLATQRLEEGKLKGLESYLRYRICLRTFSAQESSIVLGKPDAYYLPSAPGVGYIKIDANTPVRFKTALISSPYVPATQHITAADIVRGFTTTGKVVTAHPRKVVDETGQDMSEDSTEMDVVIARLARASTAAQRYRVHQVWLPPLERTIRLGSLLRTSLNGASVNLERIWHATPPFGLLNIPIGLLDVPLDQEQRPMLINFSGAGGHLAIVGAPQSGKSTLLRTLITSFIMTHSPRDVQLYCIDLGGGQFRTFESAPHVGAVCTKAEREKIYLLIRLMYKVIADREILFREHNIESMATYRMRRQAGELAEAPFGDVFLIIDNLAQFQHDFEQLESDILTLVTTGLTYGVHIVVATNRWPEIRPKVRDNIGTRLELRINDPIESEIDRKKAAELPVGLPGRGLTKEKLQFQTCLPWVGGSQENVANDSSQQQAVETLVRRTQAWQGARATSIKMLPARVQSQEIRRPANSPSGVLIGLEEFRLEPMYIDLLANGPHFVVLGDAECGKTNLLRLWMRELEERYTPQEVMFAAIECRTTVNLFEATRSAHCLTYASMRMPSSVKETIDCVSGKLKERMLPTSFTSIKDLGQQQSWQGPHYFLFVDDYEAVASPTGSPLAPLRDLILQARDTGFHLILTRSVGGMGSSSFEAIVKCLREMGSPGLIMSGDRQEGKLLHDQVATNQPVGRGTLARRKHPPTQVQVALV